MSGYPGAVKLRVRRVVDGRLADDELEVVAAGALTAGAATALFAARRGEPVPVEFSPNRPVELDAEMAGGTSRVPLSVDACPPAGTYYVGLRLDSAHVATLELRPVSNGPIWTYVVGALPGDPNVRKP